MQEMGFCSMLLQIKYKLAIENNYVKKIAVETKDAALVFGKDDT